MVFVTKRLIPRSTSSSIHDRFDVRWDLMLLRKQPQNARGAFVTRVDTYIPQGEKRCALKVIVTGSCKANRSCAQRSLLSFHTCFELFVCWCSHSKSFLTASPASVFSIYSGNSKSESMLAPGRRLGLTFDSGMIPAPLPHLMWLHWYECDVHFHIRFVLRVVIIARSSALSVLGTEYLWNVDICGNGLATKNTKYMFCERISSKQFRVFSDRCYACSLNKFEIGWYTRISLNWSKAIG